MPRALIEFRWGPSALKIWPCGAPFRDIWIVDKFRYAPTMNQEFCRTVAVTAFVTHTWSSSDVTETCFSARNGYTQRPLLLYWPYDGASFPVLQVLSASVYLWGLLKERITEFHSRYGRWVCSVQSQVLNVSNHHEAHEYRKRYPGV